MNKILGDFVNRKSTVVGSTREGIAIFKKLTWNTRNLEINALYNSVNENTNVSGVKS